MHTKVVNNPKSIFITLSCMQICNAVNIITYIVTTQKSIARLLYKIVNHIYNFIRKSPFSVKKDKKHFYTIVFYPHRIKFIFTPWLFIRMQKIPITTSSFGHFYRYEKHIEYVFHRFGEVVVEEEVVVELNHLALKEIMLLSCQPPFMRRDSKMSTTESASFVG